MSDLPIYAAYVDTTIGNLRRGNMMLHPGGIPPDMIDLSTPTLGDWIGWKPVSSRVTGADLNEIEAKAGFALPPLYRSFLQYKHFIRLMEFGIRFINHSSLDWKKNLTEAIFGYCDSGRAIDRGLLPFGSEAFMDAGQVCFDMRAQGTDGDCPVVFLDYEWMGTDREIQLMFSSCRKMFECLTLAANSDQIFEASGLPRGGVFNVTEVIRCFYQIDPSGVGANGKEYWSAWE